MSNKKDYMKKYNADNKVRLNTMKRAYYGADRAYYLMKGRINRWKNAGINITFEKYEQLRGAQNYSCAICNTHESRLSKALAVDHDHKTGKIRGLLCMDCNLLVVRVLEKYGDRLPKAAAYLERSNGA